MKVSIRFTTDVSIRLLKLARWQAGLRQIVQHVWIEFETPGAEERLHYTELADKIGNIEIRYSQIDGIYDLMITTGPKYYIYETSFTSISEAREVANLVRTA
jgi:hypothetical protein